MSKLEIITDKRDAVFAEIGNRCAFSSPGEFMQVTRWSNGEGYDIEIANKLHNPIMRLTQGEFRLLKKLIKKLDK